MLRLSSAAGNGISSLARKYSYAEAYQLGFIWSRFSFLVNSTHCPTPRVTRWDELPGSVGRFPISSLERRFASSSSSNGASDLPSIDGKGPPPEEPPAGLCCMSGCANCVWLEHAKELMKYYDDGGVKAEEALKKIKDPSLKAFLKFEFDALKLRK